MLKYANFQGVVVVESKIIITHVIIMKSEILWELPCDTGTQSEQMLFENDSNRVPRQGSHKSSVCKDKTKTKTPYLQSTIKQDMPVKW